MKIAIRKERSDDVEAIRQVLSVSVTELTG